MDDFNLKQAMRALKANAPLAGKFWDLLLEHYHYFSTLSFRLPGAFPPLPPLPSLPSSLPTLPPFLRSTISEFNEQLASVSTGRDSTPSYHYSSVTRKYEYSYASPLSLSIFLFFSSSSFSLMALS